MDATQPASDPTNDNPQSEPQPQPTPSASQSIPTITDPKTNPNTTPPSIYWASNPDSNSIPIIGEGNTTLTTDSTDKQASHVQTESEHINIQTQIHNPECINAIISPLPTPSNESSVDATQNNTDTTDTHNGNVIISVSSSDSVQIIECKSNDTIPTVQPTQNKENTLTNEDIDLNTNETMTVSNANEDIDLNTHKPSIESKAIENIDNKTDESIANTQNNNNTDTHAMDIDETQTQTNNTANNGIGPEQTQNETAQTNAIHSDKQEMDIDEDEVHELVPRRKKKISPKTPPKQVRKPNTGVLCKFNCGKTCNPGNTPRGNPFDTCCKSCAVSNGANTTHDSECNARNNVRTQTPNANTQILNNNNVFGPEYNEDEDEDFNAEEEDDGSDHSEDIIGEDEESNDYSELADIDIVNDDTIYTEEAPRWLVKISELSDSENEFNIEEAYQNWEMTKQSKGGLYSDESGDGDNGGMVGGDAWFENLLNKYRNNRTDPMKDKIKSKGDSYKLDDAFINDEDCFELNLCETKENGFFISQGRPHVTHNRSPKNGKKDRKKDSKSKITCDIPQSYQIKIDKIGAFVNSNASVMTHVTKHRKMYGILNGKYNYLKHTGMAEYRDGSVQNKEVRYDGQSIRVYRQLLTMLLEFDFEILREKGLNRIDNNMKKSIYRQVMSILRYPSNSDKKLQYAMEELLDWFSLDWYDCEDEAQSLKINWRNLYLQSMKKRSQARFNNKKRPKNKSESNGEKKQCSKADVPWDEIGPEIFLTTSYAMENAAFNEGEVDTACHAWHLSTKESLAKNYTNIGMADVERVYNAQKRRPFPSVNHCNSHLIVSRIKEANRTHKKKKLKTQSKKSRKHSSKPAIDLTNNNSNTNSTAQIPHLSPVKKRSDIEAVIHGTKEINIKPQITATIPCYAPQSNTAVIDLTDSNEITVSHSVSMTPMKTEQKSKNSRKRRYHEMDTKNNIEAMDDRHSKRIKLTQTNTNTNTNESNGMREEFKSETQASYQTMNESLSEGSLIGIKINDETLKIGVVQRTDQTRVWYRDYVSDIGERYCAYDECYHIISYMDSSVASHSKTLHNYVYALPMKSECEFEMKYVSASVYRQPQSMGSDNGLIGVQYKDVRMEIPLFTIHKSEVYKLWETRKIPTVIKIVSVTGSAVQQNSNSNSLMRGKGPMKSSLFFRQLPHNPWNDKYFQG